MNLFGFVALLALAVGLAAALAPLVTRTRGIVLQGLAIGAAVAVAILTALGLASSIDGLPNHRATLVAKFVGGGALLLVPLLRLRSIRRGLGQVLHPQANSSHLPFSFRRTKQRSNGSGRGRHFGAARTVRNASVIEALLLMAAVVVTVFLMRQ